MCCLPVQIKSKYYPWALLVFFSLFFGLQLDLFVGVAVGYLHIYGHLERFGVTTQRAKAWESRFPFSGFSQKPEFVKAEFAMNADAGLPTFVRSAPANNNQVRLKASYNS